MPLRLQLLERYEVVGVFESGVEAPVVHPVKGELEFGGFQPFLFVTMRRECVYRSADGVRRVEVSLDVIMSRCLENNRRC